MRSQTLCFFIFLLFSLSVQINISRARLNKHNNFQSTYPNPSFEIGQDNFNNSDPAIPSEDYEYEHTYRKTTNENTHETKSNIHKFQDTPIGINAENEEIKKIENLHNKIWNVQNNKKYQEILINKNNGKKNIVIDAPISPEKQSNVLTKT